MDRSLRNVSSVFEAPGKIFLVVQSKFVTVFRKLVVLVDLVIVIWVHEIITVLYTHFKMVALDTGTDEMLIWFVVNAIGREKSTILIGLNVHVDTEPWGKRHIAYVEEVLVSIEEYTARSRIDEIMFRRSGIDQYNLRVATRANCFRSKCVVEILGQIDSE